jgi:Uma2 family endonuclease
LDLEAFDGPQWFCDEIGCHLNTSAECPLKDEEYLREKEEDERKTKDVFEKCLNCPHGRKHEKYNAVVCNQIENIVRDRKKQCPEVTRIILLNDEEEPF